MISKNTETQYITAETGSMSQGPPPEVFPIEAEAEIKKVQLLLNLVSDAVKKEWIQSSPHPDSVAVISVEGETWVDNPLERK